jgi:hypothetical protein
VTTAKASDAGCMTNQPNSIAPLVAVGVMAIVATLMAVQVFKSLGDD